MNTPHKHAAQIHEWADGAKIQWEDVMGDWADCVGNPTWYVGTAFRAKPAPLRYRNALMKKMSENSYYVSIMTDEVDTDAVSEWPGFIRWLGDWQEVTEN